MFNNTRLMLERTVELYPLVYFLFLIFYAFSICLLPLLAFFIVYNFAPLIYYNVCYPSHPFFILCVFQRSSRGRCTNIRNCYIYFIFVSKTKLLDVKDLSFFIHNILQDIQIPFSNHLQYTYIIVTYHMY